MPSPSTQTLKRLSVLGFLVAVACLIVLLYRSAILGTNIAAWIIQGAAVLLMIWARITFGMRSFHAAANTTAGSLVTHGPFAYVRNPIYASVIYFAWAAVACHLSLVNVLLALGIAAGLCVRIFAEEQFLRATYPEYADYCRRVKRLVPYIF